MSQVIKYRFFLWILLSIGFFVFIVPVSPDVLIKLVAGYVFYLFVKEIFNQKHEESRELDERIDVLRDRMERIPRKTDVYIHEEAKEKEEQAIEEEQIERDTFRD